MITKHEVLFSDDQYEISYQKGKDGFYFREKSKEAPAFPNTYEKIKSPFDIAIRNKEMNIVEEISIVEEGMSDSLSARKKDNRGHWEYGIFSTLSEAYTNPDENHLITNSFDWHNERNNKLVLTKDIPGKVSSILRDDVAARFNQNHLSLPQKRLVSEPLCGIHGVLYDLKENCISQEEYARCLIYLIEGGDKPVPMLSEASQALEDLALYLKEDRLHLLGLNQGAACTAGDHIATLGEAKQFVQMVFQEALRQVDSTYNEKVPPLESTGSWNHLCYPGQSKNMMIASGYVSQEAEARGNFTNCEIYKQRDISLEVREQSAKLIQTIAAIYQPLNPTSVKEKATLDELNKASQALQFLLTSQFYPSPSSRRPHPLLNYSFPFLSAMANEITQQKEDFELIKQLFLLPLNQAVHEKISQLQQSQDQPLPTQFQALPVDKWNGVSRPATHADFVNEQFKNPQAIFIIPDNFKDANLPPNQRHNRKGRGGLAGPMRPVLVSEKDGLPIYDLCTLGIPTGGDFEGDATAAKDEITEHFAKLYGEIRKGRTIVVPYVTHEGKLVPAFGIGTFAGSALTAELKTFILEEFDKLEKFCNGNPTPENLNDKYKKAWNDAAAADAAILPLPQIVMPEPPGILGQDLNNPGIRANFNTWFQGKGELTEHVDEESHARTLTGTFKLSTGDTEAQVTIHKDRIVLNNADEMTPEQFKEAMGEVIQLYIAGYKPGDPPPARPFGTDEQKAIISQLLTDARVRVAPDKPAIPSAAAAGNAAEPPANTSVLSRGPSH